MLPNWVMNLDCYDYNNELTSWVSSHIACITQEKLLHAPQLSYECRRLYNEHDEFHYISQKKGEAMHYSSCSMLPNGVMNVEVYTVNMISFITYHQKKGRECSTYSGCSMQYIMNVEVYTWWVFEEVCQWECQ